MADAPQVPADVPTPAAGRPEGKKSPTLASIFRRNLIAGLLVLLPLGVCLWVLTLAGAEKY